MDADYTSSASAGIKKLNASDDLDQGLEAKHQEDPLSPVMIIEPYGPRGNYVTTRQE